MLKTNHCSESECIHDGYEQINQSSGTSAASYRVRDYRLVADRTRLLYGSLKKKEYSVGRVYLLLTGISVRVGKCLKYRAGGIQLTARLAVRSSFILSMYSSAVFSDQNCPALLR